MEEDFKWLFLASTVLATVQSEETFLMRKLCFSVDYGSWNFMLNAYKSPLKSWPSGDSKREAKTNKTSECGSIK